MKRFCELNDRECIQNKIAGLGEKSFRKSYYSELQKIERFKALLDQSNDAIFLLSIPDGRFIDVNDSACQQLGYDCKDLLKMSIDDIICDSTGTIKGILSGNVSSIVFNVSLCGQTGEKTPYEINARRVNFGGKTYAIMAARNIEKRLHIEHELRESEEKFRVLAETSAAAIFVYQGEYNVSVNKAAEVITGYTKDELLRMKYWEILDPEFRDMVRERSLARQRGEQVPSRYEIKLLTKSGETRWAELTAGRILYKGKHAGVATIFDITERKQAEEDISKLAFIVLSSDEAIVGKRMDGIITSWNTGAEKIYGYTSDEMIGRSISTLIPPDRPGELNKILDWIKLGEHIKNYETERITKDNRRINVSITISPVIDSSGKIVGASAITRDITERKRAEEALSDAKAQSELYIDLMSHDINNLNQVALGYLELADDLIKSGGKLEENNRELIEKPMASLNNSTKLIDKVIKLRKLQTKELRLNRVDVCDVLIRLNGRYSHFSGRDVTINYIPTMECLVMANELIDEIFVNLIDNSIKHSPRDRPLVIDILQTTVCENGKEYLRISIEDNGPGISDEVKENLFARFSRGKTKAKGKGLGLYLIKTLVEDFHGKVWVEDRVLGDYTKGSRFIVMLPVAG